MSLPVGKSLTVGQILEVNVEKLTIGGYGLARFDQFVIFVPLSAPNELLEIEITQLKKKYAFGKILRILQPGSSRVNPLCEVYSKCGGCNLQHVSYEAQLEQKQQIVKEYILRSFPQLEGVFKPIIKSPHPFHYRNRIQLKKEGSVFGFYAKKSHILIPIEKCCIADEKAMVEAKLELTSENVGFSQVNPGVNQLLINLVIDICKNSSLSAPAEFPQKNKDINPFYDLYAGSGNFTFQLAKSFPYFTFYAVEADAKSLSKGQEILATSSDVKNKISFFLSDVESFLKRVPLQDNSFVLIDPPRSGCSPLTISYLAFQKFQHFIYISCNLSTLVRDLELFFSQTKHVWKIESIQALDMFPQTDHIETLISMRRFD